MANALIDKNPALVVKEITDAYIRQNFDALRKYFNENNQLYGFKYFEVEFSDAVTNYRQAHGLQTSPQDLIITNMTGAATIDFNKGLFSLTEFDMTVSAACKVSFFLGTYWNRQSPAISNSTDVQRFTSVINDDDASSSSTSANSSSSSGTTTSTTKIPTVQVFTSGSGAYIPTSGIVYAKVTVVGAGGGGGTSASGGGGGGGGGLSMGYVSAAVIGSGLSYSVGSGGAIATAGGTSSFGGTLMQATGGSAGATGAPGAGGAGGVGSGGNIVNSTGSPGFFGFTYAGVGNFGGNGGSSFFGGGARGGNTGGGIAGSAYGGGGSGSGGSGTGAVGFAGIIIVEEFF